MINVILCVINNLKLWLKSKTNITKYSTKIENKDSLSQDITLIHKFFLILNKI